MPAKPAGPRPQPACWRIEVAAGSLAFEDRTQGNPARPVGSGFADADLPAEAEAMLIFLISEWIPVNWRHLNLFEWRCCTDGVEFG